MSDSISRLFTIFLLDSIFLLLFSSFALIELLTINEIKGLLEFCKLSDMYDLNKRFFKGLVPLKIRILFSYLISSAIALFFKHNKSLNIKIKRQKANHLKFNFDKFNKNPLYLFYKSFS